MTMVDSFNSGQVPAEVRRLILESAKQTLVVSDFPIAVIFTDPGLKVFFGVKATAEWAARMAIKDENLLILHLDQEVGSAQSIVPPRPTELIG